MIYDIRDYGAVGDGVTNNTKAIQSAIDRCVKEGGGRVLITDGVYMTGTVVLGSGVELHIAQNTTLLGSPRCEDYPERKTRHVDANFLTRWRNACLIYAEEVENISITGMGKIDCNGTNFIKKTDGTDRWGGWEYVRIDAPTPPREVFFAGCKNVRIEDITMVNQPAGWSYWIHDCDFVTFSKVKIFAEVQYPNNDGIHINCSRNVNISDCNIVCGDDCIIIRANSASLKENKLCERVTVTNCNLTSYSAGIRIAWLRDGDIRNCTCSNIVMTDCTTGIDFQIPYYEPDPERKNVQRADIGREDTLIENFAFSNIIMNKIYGCPVRFMIDPRARISGINNIYFNGIHANSVQHVMIQGQKDKPIRNVRFTDCDFDIISVEEFDRPDFHGAQSNHEHKTYPPVWENVENLVMNATRFSFVHEK